ncbi:arrestin domain-containing protein 1-like [Schistocerca americana]|uniref:arrestin domain-containing protein 1-like n=1 Tax=Schistocerca americana TaxID=7009 RepID=UPI001F5008D7|nr:arrestin domain-containing protein 1-like [Schistocerca americana]
MLVASDAVLQARFRPPVIITSISGIATIKTNGTDGSPQRNKRVRVYFEKVFQFCSLSNGVNNKNPLWNEGSHKYNFTYKLPKGIPSSFESPDGHVRYKICAFVDAAETQNQNLTDMRFFCVNSVLNLNGINKISSPKTVFKHDELSCLCIRFRTVSVVLSLMKRGFVPGENIVINAVIYNGTSSVIPRVEAKLVQRVKYNFKNYSSELKGTVAEIVRGPVMPSESQIWRNEKLLIPPVVTSQLLSGNLINVDYKMCEMSNVDMAAINAWVIYNIVMNKKMERKKFILQPANEFNRTEEQESQAKEEDSELKLPRKWGKCPISLCKGTRPENSV